MAAAHAPIITTDYDDTEEHGDFDPALDRDGNGEHPNWEVRVKETLRKLDHIATRQWTYVKEGRRARFTKAGKKPTKPGTPRDPSPDHFLTDAEFRVLLALVMCADKDLSNSFPGLPKLAKDNGWRLDVLRALVGGLVRKGWVKRRRRSQLGTMVNEFCIPAGVLAPWDNGWPVSSKGRQRGDREGDLRSRG